MLLWAAITFVLLLPLTLLVRNRPEETDARPDGDIPDSAGGGRPRGLAVNVRVREYTTSPGKNLSEATRTGSFWLLSGAHFICGIGCGFMATHIVIFAT